MEPVLSEHFNKPGKAKRIEQREVGPHFFRYTFCILEIQKLMRIQNCRSSCHGYIISFCSKRTEGASILYYNVELEHKGFRLKCTFHRVWNQSISRLSIDGSRENKMSGVPLCKTDWTRGKTTTTRNSRLSKFVFICKEHSKFARTNPQLLRISTPIILLQKSCIVQKNNVGMFSIDTVQI